MSEREKRSMVVTADRTCSDRDVRPERSGVAPDSDGECRGAAPVGATDLAAMPTEPAKEPA